MNHVGGRRAYVVWSSWAVGVVLVFAGIQKGADLWEYGAVSAALQHLQWFDWLQTVAILPEIVIGVALLGSVPNRKAIAAAAGLSLVFTAVAGALVVYGGTLPRCVCLGRRVNLPIYWHLTLVGALTMVTGASLSVVNKLERE